jgi:hypothetical protein
MRDDIISSFSPVFGPMEAQAFFSSVANPNAWQRAEDIKRPLPTGDKATFIYRGVLIPVNIAQRFPQIEDIVKRSNLYSREVYEVIPKAPVVEFPRLTNVLSVGGVSVRVTSDAQFRDNAYTTRSVISVSGIAEASTVYSPYLTAVRRRTQSSVSSFAANLLEFRASPSSIGSAPLDVSDKFGQDSETKSSGLFIVYHPITIMQGSDRDCVLAGFYSNVPISTSLDLCNIE